MEKRNHQKYKSPILAFFWSFMMCGFGQFYNEQYIFGTVLLLCEGFVNVFSKLNVSIMHSFHGNIQMAHDVINFKWGLFYPSLYVFGIWQAYNKAIILNYQRKGKEPPKKTDLTGFCLGLAIGMNIGVAWHPHFLAGVRFFEVFISPVFNGILLGVIGGITGHWIEKIQKRK
jgi:TM2 domain-containing membrane protein YozV